MSKGLAKLLFVLGADINEFQTEFRRAEKDLKKMGASMQKVGKDFSKYLTVPITAAGGASYVAFRNMNEAMKQVEAGLESTGGTVGYTSDELKKMATEMGRLTATLNTDILSGVTSQLLTFTNISGKVFEDAQMAALNLSARLGTDLKSASIQVGKALNDPIQGITSLTRSGVQFTEEQRNMIRSMVEMGDVTGAQTIILQELETQFGGSAAAAGDSLDRMKNSAIMMGQGFGEIIHQYLSPFFERIADIIDRFSELDQSTKKIIVGVSALAAAIGPLLIVMGTFVKTILPLLLTGLRAATIAYARTTAGIVAMTKAATYKAIALKAKTIALKAATVAMRIFNTILRANPLGMVLTAILAVTAAFYDFRKIARDAARDAWDESTRNAIEEDRKELEFLKKRYMEYGMTAEEASLRAAKAMRESIKTAYENTSAQREMRDEEKKMHTERISELDMIITGYELEKSKTLEIKDAVAELNAELDKKNEKARQAAPTAMPSLGTNSAGPELQGRSTPPVNSEYLALMREYNLAMMDAETRNRVFGESFNLIGAQLAETQNAINSLIELGFDENDAAVQRLMGTYSALNDELLGLQDNYSSLGEQIINWAQISQNAAQQVATGFMNMAEMSSRSIGGLISDILRQITTQLILSIVSSLPFPANIAVAGGAGAIASGLFSNIPKMATGGVIPPGFPNDTYPAFLSSGEIVTPPGRLDDVAGGSHVEVDVTVGGKFKMGDLLFEMEKVETRRKKTLGR